VADFAPPDIPAADIVSSQMASSQTASSQIASSQTAPLDQVASAPGASAASTLAAAKGDIDWQLPDLFVVDGGRGQLGVALAAAHDLGLHDLCIVGLAKEKENVIGDKLTDRVYLPGQKNPISLRPNSPELFLLARARDEAHRFSNRGRTKVGKRRRFESELDRVPGIGPKTRTTLLKTLGSVAGLRLASDETILAVPGVTKRHLQALRQAFANAEAARAAAGAETATADQDDLLDADDAGAESEELEGDDVGTEDDELGEHDAGAQQELPDTAVLGHDRELAT
jgi:excinuclease ABC subunit C